MAQRKVVSEEKVYIVPRINSKSGEEEERILKSATTFDSEGRQLQESAWDLNGNYEQITKSLYGQDGLLVTQEIYLDEKHLSETHRYEFDGEGRVAQEKIEYAEGGEELIRYTYDDGGNLRQKEFTSEDGEQEALEVREFVGDKMVYERREEYGEVSIERRLQYVDGRLVSEKSREDFTETEISYEYDDMGRIAALRETINGKPGKKYAYGYDEEGRLISERSLVNGVWHETLLEYDSYGNELLREEKLPNGNTVLRIVRAYDDDGLLLSTEVEADTMGIGIDRHYRYIYEYRFH